jgi:hypothetical protein
MTRDTRPVLIQGSPGVRVTPEGKGMIIEWNALYGYYIDGGNDRKALTHDASGSFNKESIWRDADRFGYYAYNVALHEIGKRTKGPDKAALNGANNLPDMVEITTDEYYTLEDLIMDIMDEKLLWQPGNIRQSRGHYRWIGLGTRTPQPAYPSTRIVIPDVNQGTKPLAFRGHVLPLAEGTDAPVTPRTDWTQTSTICGIIHAFADRPYWDPRTAIWAAHFENVYGPGMMSLDKLFSNACRIGVTPRLSTKLQFQNTDGFYPAYNKLAALAITTKWFSRMFWGGARAEAHQWMPNEGCVRYWISGTTPATILQGKIQRFARANMVIFGTRASPTSDAPAEGSGKSGIYYMPVTNEHGAAHRLSFAALPTEEGASQINLAPVEEPRLYAELDTTVLTLDKNQVLILTDDQALSDSWYPTEIELSRSVTQMTEFLPLGLRRYSRMIRDKEDPEVVKPLGLLKTMMIGWGLKYPPASGIFTGISTPSHLDEFSDFEIIQGRSAK